MKNLRSLIFLLLLLFGAHSVFAEDYSSSDYTVLAPVIAPGGSATSPSFSLNGVISQVGIGSSSATSLKLFGGFLYFPFVSTPVVSAVPGDGQVALSWTSGDASGGLSIGSYAIGQSTTSGGLYIYTPAGNVLSTTPTGLTNGTRYYFVVRVRDALGNYIATSTEISAVPVAPTVSPSPSPSPSPSSSPAPQGSGAGNDTGDTGTGVIFSGRAFPLSTVKILKDGQLALSTIAGPDSKFKASITNLTAGNYNFSVYGEDSRGVRSSSFSFPVTITKDVMTEVGGIFIAPTISVDKSEVKKGDTITIFGQSTPSANIMINVNSEQEYIVSRPSDKTGAYLLNFDTSLLEKGNHSTKSKAVLQNEISTFSNALGFIVGDKNILANVASSCAGKGDLNKDCTVNLVDFSIAAFWYKKSLSDAFKAIEKERLNGDGKIDLTDFSIMAFHWNG